MTVLVFFRADWDHASVCYFTDFVLELDCCVINFKFVVQTFFYVAQNTFAHGRRDIGD